MAITTMDLMFALKATDQASSILRRVQSESDRTARHLSKIQRASAGLYNAGKGLAKTGAWTSAAGAAMTAGEAKVLGVLTGLQDSMAKVRTVASEADAAMTRAAAIDWSTKHTDRASEYADATYMMFSAGLKGKAAVDATAKAMQVAKATMGDGVTAANLLATVFNNMRDKAKPAADEINRLGDILTTTQQTFQIKDLSQLNESFKEGSKGALGIGVNVKQLAVILGALNTAGLQGSTAGTAFTSAMDSLQSAARQLRFGVARTKDGSIDLVKTIGNIEERFGNLADLSPRMQERMAKAFGGTQALSMFRLLVGKSKELTQGLEAINNAAGSSARGQAIMENTLSQHWLIAKNRLAAVAVTAGQGLLPILESGVKTVSEWATGVHKWAQEHQTLATILLGGVGVVGPLLTAAGLGMTIIGMGMSGLGKGIGAVSSAARGVGKSWTWAKTVPGKLATVNETIRGHKARIVSLISQHRIMETIRYRGGFWPAMQFQLYKTKLRFLDAITTTKTWAAAQWASARANLGSAKAIRATSAAAGAKLLGALKSAAASTWAFNTALLANPMTWVVGAVIGGAILIWKYWKPISGFFRGLWQGIKEGLGPMIEAFKPLGVVFDPLISGIKTVLGWLGDLLTPVDDVGGAAESMGLRVGKVIGSMIGGFGKFVAFVFGLPVKLISAGADMAGSVWRGLKDGWASLTGWLGGAFDRVKTVFSGDLVGGLVRIFKTFNPISAVSKALNGVVNYVTGIDLTKAGANIINTVWQGIKSMAHKPLEALRSIVSGLRDFLPFSPAKTGPLKDLNKVRLAETVAETITPGPMAKAMRAAAAAAMLAASPVTALALPTIEAPLIQRPVLTAPAQVAAMAQSADPAPVRPIAGVRPAAPPAPSLALARPLPAAGSAKAMHAVTATINPDPIARAVRAAMNNTPAPAAPPVPSLTLARPLPAPVAPPISPARPTPDSRPETRRPAAAPTPIDPGRTVNITYQVTIQGDAGPETRAQFAKMLQEHKHELTKLLAEIDRDNRRRAY